LALRKSYLEYRKNIILQRLNLFISIILYVRHSIAYIYRHNSLPIIDLTMSIQLNMALCMEFDQLCGIL